MLLKLLNRSEDVHVKESTMKGRLPSSVFASCDVEGELAVVVEFVVGVVGAYEDFNVAHCRVFEF